MTCIDEKIGGRVHDVACFEGRVAKVAGPVRSGKTEALVQRACTLVARGVDPQSILLATSTAEAARVLRCRLARAFAHAGIANPDEQAARCQVSTARELCIQLLSQPQVKAATGRNPRVLLPFEYNFFLEDLKTLGLPARRLRKLLTRFKHQWCALAPEEDWAVPGDETDTLKLTHRLLDAQDAMLEEELAYVCGRFLQSPQGAAFAKAYTYGLVDDFQNLSHAQQTCLCLMVRDQLIVAGNANEATSCASAFPHPRGFTDFDTLRRTVQMFELQCAYGNPRISALCDSIAASCAQGPRLAATERVGTDEDLTLVKWNTPEDEFNGLTRLMLAESQDEGAPVGSQVAVIVPNRQWERAFRQMLTQRGFATSSLGFERLSGDPRTLERSRALQAFTALTLTAHPDDTTAWRCWLGFGNYLTNSDAWQHLLEFADEQNLGLLEALDEVQRRCAQNAEAAPFLRAEALITRYQDGRALIERNAKRRGYSLLAALGMQDMPEFAALAEALDGDEDAEQLCALARRMQESPVHTSDLHAVRISSYEQMCGCSYERVFAVGCVDGFMPARDAFEVVSTDADRNRIMDKGRRAFLSALGKAGKQLTVSTFSKADLELAERTKMQVTRVRAEGDARIATLRPTCFITEAGANAPLTVGGQALLSERGID